MEELETQPTEMQQQGTVPQVETPEPAQGMKRRWDIKPTNDGLYIITKDFETGAPMKRIPFVAGESADEIISKLVSAGYDVSNLSVKVLRQFC